MNGMAACVWVALGVLARSGSGLVVTGQVVDRQARPVEGAEVIVYEQYRPVIAEEPDFRRIGPSAKTDAGGRFRLQAQVTEWYGAFIVARKPGYACAWDVLNDGPNTKDKQESLLVLEPPCVVTGRVFDPNGRPVGGAQVRAVPVTSYLERLNQRPIIGPKEWFTTTTDAQGVFRFEQFAGDVSVTFRVQAPGRECSLSFRPHRLNACGFEVWRSDLRLMLPGTGVVKGRVMDRQGRPVTDVELLLSDGPNEGRVIPLTRRTRPDAQGQFVFAGAPQGSYDIDLLAPEQGPDLWVAERVKVSVKTGQATEGTIVHVEEGVALAVTVLAGETRRPVAGTSVSVYGPAWCRTRPALTDAQGRARLRIRGGTIKVYVSAQGLLRWDEEVKTTEGQTLGREIVLTSVPRISGRVSDAADQPVAGAVVTVHPWGDQVTTDAQGRFIAGGEELTDSEGGFVMARDVKHGLAGIAPVKDVSQPVAVKLRAALNLTGKVADPNGRGVPAARVSLLVAGGRWYSNAGVEVLTDAQGRFELAALPPVQDGLGYRLSVAAAGYGLRERARISPDGPPGASVDIGTTELPWAGASVSGVVVDANGAPAPWVPVFVNNLVGGHQPSKTTATNEKGDFVITRVCPERIRLQANFANAPGGGGFLETLAPARDLTIVLGKRLTQAPDTSLRGKAVPPLDELGLSSAQARNKPLLLCFCDLDQRPSRQCLARLGQRINRLEAQGTILWIIQVSKVDVGMYDSWLKGNGITAPPHVFVGDFETRKAAWGVGALPWLILADSHHIVRAEGFAVTELEASLEKIGGN